MYAASKRYRGGANNAPIPSGWRIKEIKHREFFHMFGIGMPEMLLILAVALIVIGPKKLPDLAKSIGRALGEFKRATTELKESIDMNEDFADVKKTFENMDNHLDDLVDAAPKTDRIYPEDQPENKIDTLHNEPPDNLTAEVSSEPKAEPIAEPDAKPDAQLDADSGTENKHAQARENEGITPSPSDKTEKNE
jgi:TatA/E family protein of Tat protein translocase